jgi:hypothetical protein
MDAARGVRELAVLQGTFPTGGCRVLPVTCCYPASDMTNRHKRDQWLQDIEASQRNIVFPDTVQNEARFWRNLGKGPFRTSAKAGLVVLAIFVFVWAAIFLVATYAGGVLWEFVLVMIVFCGSIFGGIAWATYRSLRNLQNGRRGSQTQRR